MKTSFLNEELFSDLSLKALDSPRKRSHHNLHGDYSDPFQRMVIAIEPGSYVRPHRHIDKPEFVLCVRGKLGVLIFDSSGKVVNATQLSPGNGVAGCDIAAGEWHSLLSLASRTVFVEAKPGPYVPFSPEDFAQWAPEADTDPVAGYYDRMIQEFDKS